MMGAELACFEELWDAARCSWKSMSFEVTHAWAKSQLCH